MLSLKVKDLAVHLQKMYGTQVCRGKLVEKHCSNILKSKIVSPNMKKDIKAKQNYGRIVKGRYKV